ncbi:MAG: type II toxin-antitoxin system Phd/YefM family antitoxin [Deltaproteobacteria bacterium]|nr:type II toxin-antitoxin system Phd/YefM family antitoxin [Deltaproteobacteria bacterium]MBW2170108.1 type II toxin-antitoxin system Phd/YefM family antitoxin [Deltaproteobacteria bacterium]
MNTLNVSIAEGKKNFAKIIRASEEKKQKIIVSRRGNPVAIILPYEEHIKNKKNEALIKIKEARAIYHRAGISAEEVYEISKKELKDKR